LKRFKGKVIALEYNSTKDKRNITVGKISALTEHHLLFVALEDNVEFSMKYLQVVSLNEPEKEKAS